VTLSVIKQTFYVIMGITHTLICHMVLSGNNMCLLILVLLLDQVCTLILRLIWGYTCFALVMTSSVQCCTW